MSVGIDLPKPDFVPSFLFVVLVVGLCKSGAQFFRMRAEWDVKMHEYIFISRNHRLEVLICHDDDILLSRELLYWGFGGFSTFSGNPDLGQDEYYQKGEVRVRIV